MYLQKGLRQILGVVVNLVGCTSSQAAYMGIFSLSSFYTLTCRNEYFITELAYTDSRYRRRTIAILRPSSLASHHNTSHHVISYSAVQTFGDSTWSYVIQFEVINVITSHSINQNHPNLNRRIWNGVTLCDPSNARTGERPLLSLHQAQKRNLRLSKCSPQIMIVTRKAHFGFG